LVNPNPPVGKYWAFAVLVSDGISSELSDDEIVDLARGSPDPKAAAERILAFSEELGGEDNATAIVVPLAGWGRIEGPDKTKELREYRRKQAGRIIPICTIWYLLCIFQWEVNDSAACEMMMIKHHSDFQNTQSYLACCMPICSRV
jgi:protein phosphatase PTC6